MKLLTIILIMFLTGLSQLSLASESFASIHREATQINTSDFKVYTIHSSFSPQKATHLDLCREQIQKAICLVDPQVNGQRPEDRKCLSGGEAYSAHFEQVYDTVPEALQKMFCSLRRIFIEKEFFGTAYAGRIEKPDGTSDGAIMGVRKTVLDESLNLTNWASWKEQLSFGGDTKGYDYRKDMQLIKTQSKVGVNDFLYFLIAHEFGHIFDFSNSINKTENCRTTTPDRWGNDKVCDFAPGTWGELSWQTDRAPLTSNEFNLRSRLCFYWCSGQYLSESDILPLYSDLHTTSFISIYATTQAWDDFADSLGYFLMEKNLQATYIIETPEGIHYDIMDKLRSPVFAEKYKYIEHFLSRTDIVYP